MIILPSDIEYIFLNGVLYLKWTFSFSCHHLLTLMLKKKPWLSWDKNTFKISSFVSYRFDASWISIFPFIFPSCHFKCARTNMSVDAQKYFFNKTSSRDAGRPTKLLLLMKLFPFGFPVGVCIILSFLFNLVGRVWIFFFMEWGI